MDSSQITFWTLESGTDALVHRPFLGLFRRVWEKNRHTFGSHPTPRRCSGPGLGQPWDAVWENLSENPATCVSCPLKLKRTGYCWVSTRIAMIQKLPGLFLFACNHTSSFILILPEAWNDIFPTNWSGFSEIFLTCCVSLSLSCTYSCARQREHSARFGVWGVEVFSLSRQLCHGTVERDKN